jgi:hypothetical protein
MESEPVESAWSRQGFGKPGERHEKLLGYCMLMALTILMNDLRGALAE